MSTNKDDEKSGENLAQELDQADSDSQDDEKSEEVLVDDLRKLLDLGSFTIRGFLTGTEVLVLLRFLAVWVDSSLSPQSIAKLRDLETFFWGNRVGRLSYQIAFGLWAFGGQRWKMEQGEFPKLRFLKLESLKIVDWLNFEDCVSNLAQLVLKD
ncbi:hypothetical protein ACH5RR_036131 [Cinchona calisaya]|uniref:Uncharacterized protein n=1 Tax=Cinchona calisaya TaxID=153742 RepID=A0ABD2Y5I3_9GENT